MAIQFDQFFGAAEKRTHGMSRFSDSRTTSEINQFYCLISDHNTKQFYIDTLCLLRALAIHMHGITNLETSTSKVFNDFLEKSGRDAKQFRRVSTHILPVVESLLEKINSIYDIDLEDEDFVGELARRDICN